MYANTKNVVVKPSLQGLGDEQVDPNKILPDAGARYVFKYQLLRALAEGEFAKLDTKRKSLGSTWFFSNYAVDAMAYSNRELRIYVSILTSAPDNLLSKALSIFGKVGLGIVRDDIEHMLVDVLGSSQFRFTGAWFLSGQQRKTTTIEDSLNKILIYGAAIGAAYFLIPPIIRELKKKQ